MRWPVKVGVPILFLLALPAADQPFVFRRRGNGGGGVLLTWAASVVAAVGTGPDNVVVVVAGVRL